MQNCRSCSYRPHSIQVHRGPSDSPPRQAGRQRSTTHPRPLLSAAPAAPQSRTRSPVQTEPRRKAEPAALGLASARYLARTRRIQDRFRHGRQEGGAEAGPARQQGQAEGAQGGLHSPRYRLHLRGHEGIEADGGRAGGPHRRRGQAAQGRLRRHRLRRAGQGGEEGRQEGRRQERRREEGRRQEAAAAGRVAVPAAPVVRLPRAPPVPAAVRRPQRRGGPQLLRHLLMMPPLQAPSSFCKSISV